MSSQADFTPEEWNILFQAPVFAALYILQSGHYSSVAACGKMMAALLAITETAKPGAETELVKAIRAAIHSGQCPSRFARVPASLSEARWVTLDGCRQAARLLAQRAPDSEASAYIAWLVAIGEAVAAAPDLSVLDGQSRRRANADLARAALERLAEVLRQA